MGVPSDGANSDCSSIKTWRHLVLDDGILICIGFKYLSISYLAPVNAIESVHNSVGFNPLSIVWPALSRNFQQLWEMAAEEKLHILAFIINCGTPWPSTFSLNNMVQLNPVDGVVCIKMWGSNHWVKLTGCNNYAWHGHLITRMSNRGFHIKDL